MFHRQHLLASLSALAVMSDIVDGRIVFVDNRRGAASLSPLLRLCLLLPLLFAAAHRRVLRTPRIRRLFALRASRMRAARRIASRIVSRAALSLRLYALLLRMRAAFSFALTVFCT